MNMKSYVEIVTGFIGSGKTSFINALIQNTLMDNEKVVVIQCEVGEKDLEEIFKNNKRVIIKTLLTETPLTARYLKAILAIYNPYRVIIELNGTSDIKEILDILYTKDISSNCKLTTVFHILNAETFDVYLSNMGNFLIPDIQKSNMILINNTETVSVENLKDIKTKLEELNIYAHIIEVKNSNQLNSVLEKSKLLDNGILKKLRVYVKNI